jgi:hypothetical protein
MLREGNVDQNLAFAPAELIRNMPRDTTSAQLLTEDQGFIVSTAFRVIDSTFISIWVSNRSTRRFQKSLIFKVR